MLTHVTSRHLDTFRSFKPLQIVSSSVVVLMLQDQTSHVPPEHDTNQSRETCRAINLSSSPPPCSRHLTRRVIASRFAGSHVCTETTRSAARVKRCVVRDVNLAQDITRGGLFFLTELGSHA